MLLILYLIYYPPNAPQIHCNEYDIYPLSIHELDRLKEGKYEVQLEAKQLSPELIEYCVGSKQASKYMLPVLEKLAMVEETVIRSRQSAIESLNKVCKKLNIDDVRNVAMSILTRLAEAVWFRSKVSASALTPSLYSVLTFEEDRMQILEIHKRLCCDHMTMVKNDAYKNLVELMLENLTCELMENIKEYIVDITLKIAEKMEDEIKQDIVPQFIKAAVDDDSWHVRKYLVEELAKLYKYLDGNIAKSLPRIPCRCDDIYPLSSELIEHRCGSKEVLENLTSALIEVDTWEIRTDLIEELAKICKYLNDDFAKEKSLSMLKKLASHESPQTRLNLCSKLSNVSSILAIDLFESKNRPLLNEVTIDQKCLVRNSIVTNIAEIRIQMGKDKFCKSRLRDILIQSLKNPTSTVRETAAQQVNILNNSFGFEWIKAYIFEEMKKIYSQSGDYLHHMLPLKTIQLMAQSTGKNKLTSKMIKTQFEDLLLAVLKDSILNILQDGTFKISNFDSSVFMNTGNFSSQNSNNWMHTLIPYSRNSIFTNKHNNNGNEHKDNKLNNEFHTNSIFIAPELLDPKQYTQVLDNRLFEKGDIWSLGCLLLYLLYDGTEADCSMFLSSYASTFVKTSMIHSNPHKRISISEVLTFVSKATEYNDPIQFLSSLSTPKPNEFSSPSFPINKQQQQNGKKGTLLSFEKLIRKNYEKQQQLKYKNGKIKYKNKNNKNSSMYNNPIHSIMQMLLLLLLLSIPYFFIPSYFSSL